MHSLESMQADFIATINEGPGALNQTLFAGPIDRIMLGLKAHANTINHARLVALEETFPLTREALGEREFNTLSRVFVETAEARACDGNSIGLHFPAFLNDPIIAELAAIEWAWLESYHAADGAPLSLADISGLPEERLIALKVAAHPSAHIVSLTAPLSSQLADIAALMSNPAAILAVRPKAEVLLVPLDAATTNLFYSVKKIMTVGNLLALAAEQQGVTDPSGPVMTLLGAGALMEITDAGAHSPL
jgi:Putative DNA-binding domain